MDIKNEIMRRVEDLPLESQRQVLAYVDSFQHASARGEKGQALLSFAGVLDDTSASEMREAIEASCESVDVREW
jgi:hypothetical protein